MDNKVCELGKEELEKVTGGVDKHDFPADVVRKCENAIGWADTLLMVLNSYGTQYRAIADNTEELIYQLSQYRLEAAIWRFQNVQNAIRYWGCTEKHVLQCVEEIRAILE